MNQFPPGCVPLCAGAATRMPSLKFLLQCTCPAHALHDQDSDIFHQLQMIHYRNLLPHTLESTTILRYNGDAFLPYLQHQKLINHFELCRQHCLKHYAIPCHGASQLKWKWGIKFHFPRIKRDNAKKSSRNIKRD